MNLLNVAFVAFVRFIFVLHVVVFIECKKNILYYKETIPIAIGRKIPHRF